MDRNQLLFQGIPAGLLVVSTVVTLLDGDRATRTATVEASTTATVSTQIETDKLKAEAVLAETRYLSGQCKIATTPIAPGFAVKQPQQTGTPICDRMGTTAITDKHGRLVQIATTGDTSIIQRGLGQ